MAVDTSDNGKKEEEKSRRRRRPLPQQQQQLLGWNWFLSLPRKQFKDTSRKKGATTSTTISMGSGQQVRHEDHGEYMGGPHDLFFVRARCLSAGLRS